MSKKSLITTLVLVALLAGGYYLFGIDKANGPDGRLAGEQVISVSITVDATVPADTVATYGISVPAGSSVYDAMRIARDKGRLDFNGREFSGLGFFIEEINGIAGDGENGTYWTYSVNGKEAEVGVSAYILENGDAVAWEYGESDF